jgi:pilus assembly protein CpaC
VALLAAAVPVKAEEIRLAQGNHELFQAPQPIERVAVGDPAVADVKMISPREVLVSGKETGGTTFRYWVRDHDEVQRHQILVEPRTASAERAMTALGEPGLEARPAGNGLDVTGTFGSLSNGRQAVAAAKGASDHPVHDTTRQKGKVQVQADIRVMEVSRNTLRQFGVNLASSSGGTTLAVSPPNTLRSISAPGGGTFELESSTGFLPIQSAFNLVAGFRGEGLLGAFSVLEANGFAHTLAEPSLVALSGQKATFLAGGEVPVPVDSGIQGVTVEYKEFGVRVALTPTVLDEKRIVLKVAPEVSEPDFSSTVQVGGAEVPTLRTRRTETTIQLADGETFVISGLISQESRASVDKVPYLGDIPILGAFFRSQRTERTDRELIMVVTPHLVRPLAKDADLPAFPGEKYRNFKPTFSDPFQEGRGGTPANGAGPTGFSQ